MPGQRGRPKGSKSKRTTMRENALKAVGAIGKTPLDVMIAIMQRRGIPLELQLQAARDAAPYCHPRLMAVAHMAGSAQGEDNRPRLSDAELARALLLVLARGKSEVAEKIIEGVVRE